MFWRYWHSKINFLFFSWLQIWPQVWGRLLIYSIWYGMHDKISPPPQLGIAFIRAVFFYPYKQWFGYWFYPPYEKLPAVCSDSRAMKSLLQSPKKASLCMLENYDIDCLADTLEKKQVGQCWLVDDFWEGVSLLLFPTHYLINLSISGAATAGSSRTHLREKRELLETFLKWCLHRGRRRG